MPGGCELAGVFKHACQMTTRGASHPESALEVKFQGTANSNSGALFGWAFRSGKHTHQCFAQQCAYPKPHSVALPPSHSTQQRVQRHQPLLTSLMALMRFSSSTMSVSASAAATSPVRRSPSAMALSASGPVTPTIRRTPLAMPAAVAEAVLNEACI